MKAYKNFEEIDEDLEVLKLKRNIHWEELKLTKNEFKEDVQPYSWITSAGKFVAKYGVLMIMKRLLSK